MKDLVLLVADKDMEFSLRAALDRPESLAIRRLSCSFLRHPEHDGGVRSGGAALLSLEKRSHSHAVMMLDLMGSGAGDLAAVELENDLNDQLFPVWGDRARAIVIEPELDVWMWGNDNLLRDVFGWREEVPLRKWLSSRGFAFRENGKPERPKEAIEAVMKRLRRPRSSVIYQAIARRASLVRCVDPAFVRFREQLQHWFPDGR